MKLSVIMPTLNRPDSLSETFIYLCKSIIKPEEIIIVDQSDDNKSEQILKKYNKYLNINYIHIKEKGLTHARNVGLKACTGDIIIFMDDDVNVLEDTFKSIKEIMKDDKISMIAGINLNDLGNKYNKLKYFMGYVFFTKKPFKKNVGYVTDTMLGRFPQIINDRTTTEWAMGFFFVVRKKLIDKWKLKFDENLTSYAYAEDLDFTYNYFLKSRKDEYLCIVDKKIAVYHMASQEYRITKWKHTLMYIINREYLSYKFHKSLICRIKQKWGNFGIYIDRLIKKDNPKDVLLAIYYCKKYRKDIKKGLLHTELYNLK